MHQVIECLKNLVGVTDLDCDCTPGEQPDDWQVSKSGKYLTQLLELNLIAKSGDCGSGSLGEIGMAAIEQATLEFQSNLTIGWVGSKRFKKRKDHFGKIAEITQNGPHNVTSRYAGLKITPNRNIEKGEMVINGIGTVFTNTGVDVLSVSVYDAVGLIDTYLLDTANKAYQANTLTTPLVLPFSRDGVSEQAFYLIYELGPNKPRNNKTICDCTSEIKNRILQWVDVEGITGEDIEDRCEWACDNEIANGLVPDVHLRCGVTASICGPTGELDFEQNEYAGTIAEIITYAAAAILIHKIQRSKDPNVYTNAPIDELSFFRSQYVAEVNGRMGTLIRTMDPGSCYECVSRMSNATF